MSEAPRRKSPRAPSIALDEALDRVMKAYDKERLHPSPTDVVAQHIGYKTANNGAALQALASLRYYGLLERPRDGVLAVSKDVEALRFAPDEKLRHSFLVRFLRTPPLFAELLDLYATGLPSDGNLKYELIQRGFMPTTAATLVNVFKRSVEYADYFEKMSAANMANLQPDKADSLDESPSTPARPMPRGGLGPERERVAAPPGTADDSGHDRIPIRLKGGRRAWLLIPTLFYEGDRERIKAQLDLLLTEDDE